LFPTPLQKKKKNKKTKEQKEQKKRGCGPPCFNFDGDYDESDNECCWQRQGGWPFFFVLKKTRWGK
jgi:hypothetical protein